MAPPRVTYLVPGETGRNQPRGTAKSRIWARVMPASAVRTPVFWIKGEQAVHAGGDEEVALFEEADIAVAAAHADGENGVMQVIGDGGVVALPVQRDEVGAVVGVAAPRLEQGGGGGDGFFWRGWFGHSYRILGWGSSQLSVLGSQTEPVIWGLSESSSMEPSWSGARMNGGFGVDAGAEFRRSSADELRMAVFVRSVSFSSLSVCCKRR